MNTCRLATPSDASAFAGWAALNNDIPHEDIVSAAQAVTLTLVAEVDGNPELYIPLIFSPERPLLTIAYLGFRPGQDHRSKFKALTSMIAAVRRLMDYFDCEVRVITQAEYPMGKWALKHGFTQKHDGFYLENNNVQ